MIIFEPSEYQIHVGVLKCRTGCWMVGILLCMPWPDLCRKWPMPIPSVHSLTKEVIKGCMLYLAKDCSIYFPACNDLFFLFFFFFFFFFQSILCFWWSDHSLSHCNVLIVVITGGLKALQHCNIPYILFHYSPPPPILKKYEAIIPRHYNVGSR